MQPDPNTQPDRGQALLPPRPCWTDFGGWAWLVAVAAFLALFLLPRKGVDFSDEGWMLSAALAATRGWHLDLAIPQAPTWTLNSLLMALGVESYLALRWAFYALISACLGIVLIAIESPRRLSGLKAVLVTLAGLTTLSSLISYITTPHYLILAGVGLFLLANDSRRPVIRLLLALLAGLAAAVGGFLNFTMYPAAFLCLLLGWLGCGRPRIGWLAMAAMATTSGCAIAWYLHRMGLDNFLVFPGGHGIHPGRLLLALRLVLEWLVPAAIAWAAITFLLRDRPLEERRRWRRRTAAALVLGCSLLLLPVLLFRMNVCALGSRFGPLLKATGTLGLEGLAKLNQGVPGTVVAIWGISVLVLAATLCYGRDCVSRRVLLLAACLYLCFLCQEFFSNVDPRHLPVFYAGPCLALGFYLLLRRPADLPVRLLGGAALGTTLTGAIMFSLYYNHPNLNPILGPKIDVPIRKLVGLKESPERVATLQSLVEAFEEYDCRGRTLITFQNTALLYYLLEVEPPRGLEYIYIPYSYKPDLVLQTLESSPRWCVFVSWNYLAWPSERHNKAMADPVIDYLNHHSERIVPLSPRSQPLHSYDDFVLYLGPAATPKQPRAGGPEP